VGINLNFEFIKKTIRKSLGLFRPVYFSDVKIGADLHYCDGVPENIDLNSESGKINNFKNVYVVGAPNFKFLPPESPTLSFMANAYGIGSKYASK
jgi:hypothetical protein